LNARVVAAEIEHTSGVLADLERVLKAPFDACEVVRVCNAKVRRLQGDLRRLEQRLAELRS